MTQNYTIYILSDEALTLEDTGCGEYCSLKNQIFILLFQTEKI